MRCLPLALRLPATRNMLRLSRAAPLPGKAARHLPSMAFWARNMPAPEWQASSSGPTGRLPGHYGLNLVKIRLTDTQGIARAARRRSWSPGRRP